MLTRVALLAASLTASAVLAIGLALFGLSPSGSAASPVTVNPVSATDAAPVPVTQIDTVYEVQTSPDPTPAPIVIQRVVTTGGEHEDENGGDH